MAIKVTVWNEYRHEIESEHIAKVYPNGIHNAIADFLKVEDDIETRTATLDMPEHGLTDEVLNDTDVLIWWGHMAHHEVSDEIVAKVKDHVLRGMGLIVLHSGHFSKIFISLMGTSCSLHWRDNDRERIYCVNPGHPIAAGVPMSFELEHEEMYGEFFDIPQPDELVFTGWFKGGENFRSGCCFRRGYGSIFYFQPGHEEFPTYYNENIQKVIKNAVRWANPTNRIPEIICPCSPSPEAAREENK